MSAQYRGEMGRTRPMPVQAGANIPDHIMIARVGNLAVPATAANLAAGAKFVGVAHKGLDNSDGSDGKLEALSGSSGVYPERYCVADYTGIYAFKFSGGVPELFSEVWVLDENTLAVLAPGHGQRAGIVVARFPGQQALVDFSQ